MLWESYFVWPITLERLKSSQAISNGDDVIWLILLNWTLTLNDNESAEIYIAIYTFCVVIKLCIKLKDCRPLDLLTTYYIAPVSMKEMWNDLLVQ